jgi:hypothetical protein
MSKAPTPTKDNIHCYYHPHSTGNPSLHQLIVGPKLVAMYRTSSVVS